MRDLIDRSELLKMLRIEENKYIMRAVFEYEDISNSEDVFHVDERIVKEIEKFPAATEVKNGFWIRNTYDPKIGEVIKCSECHKEMIQMREKAKYCPYCGSVMDDKKRILYYGEYQYCE